MGTLPVDVLLTYAAAILWLGLLGRDVIRGRYTPTLIFGVVFAIFLNLRYLVEGAPNAIAFFVSLYDLFDNLGLSAGQSAPALSSCPDNQCSLWGARFTQHSSWGVAFHDRFLNGPALRSNLLYLHLAFNTVTFVLMHVSSRGLRAPAIVAVTACWVGCCFCRLRSGRYARCGSPRSLVLSPNTVDPGPNTVSGSCRSVSTAAQ